LILDTINLCRFSFDDRGPTAEWLWGDNDIDAIAVAGTFSWGVEFEVFAFETRQ
jgi:hypothetical protein